MTARVSFIAGLFYLTLTPCIKAQDATAFFEKKIRPALIQHCIACHGPDKQRGGLRLDSLEAMRKGGELGTSLVPGKPDESRLIQAIRYKTDLKMPPKGKLSDAVIADLTAWVKMGAPWPGAVVKSPGPETPGADEKPFTAEQRNFWAFKPPVASTPPQVRNVAWVRNPIDRFILAKLEQQGLQPAPLADRRTLLRRMTVDLTGLPPTPEETEAYEKDAAPDATERLIDRLLSSPAYGERWGRRWLDVARYADSNGMDENLAHGNAWRYRDYVIASFNRDKPYSQFVREQLAGDLLAPTDPDSIIATGFLTIGPKMLAEDDPVKMQMDIVDEQLDSAGQAFLGLTLGCARCHDHKFDPISTQDYYGLAGIFKSTKTMNSFKVVAQWHERPLGPADPKQKNPPQAMAVAEEKSQDIRVHLRGNHLTLGKEVGRRFPRIMAGEKQSPLPTKESGRRELALWLTRDDHPLTARVMVNRLWLGHFGEGLVRSADNFGNLGERPSHPELLDWLAIEFVKRGWSIKAMHRLMMSSSTYQMSTAYNEKSAKLDPDNRLLWRFHRQRLDAESLRDSILALSGGLNRTMGGSLMTVGNRQYVTSTANRNYDNYRLPRRSVYLPVIRSAVFDLFQAFDFADPSTPSGKRPTTTIAPQALFMMNGELMQHETLRLAESLMQLPQLDDMGRVRQLFRRVYCRLPSERESTRAIEFLKRYEATGAPRVAAWQGLCRVLLSSNEFVYVE